MTPFEYPKAYYNKYRDLISTLPFGLERAVLRVLSFHIGRSNPILRADLLASVSAFNINERQLREQIRQLRRKGHLIGSAPGEVGGYYLISSSDEFQAFLQNEFLALISDMSETVTIMRKSADSLFGSGSMQPNLFS